MYILMDAMLGMWSHGSSRSREATMATNTLRRGSARIGVRARAPVTPTDDHPPCFLRTEYNDWTWIDR